MKKQVVGFTLVELLIYVVVSSIIIYGILYVFAGISQVVSTSHKYITVYEQIDNLQEDLNSINSQYINYFYATGTIFSKSESGFQACVFANNNKQKAIILGALNQSTKTLVTGNITTIEKYVPFIAQIGSGALNSILVHNAIDNSILSGALITYYDLHTLKMTCNKKPGYTKFDIVILPEVDDNIVGTLLSDWQSPENRKISLSFIK